jgi:hypothetical protein
MTVDLENGNWKDQNERAIEAELESLKLTLGDA